MLDIRSSPTSSTSQLFIISGYNQAYSSLRQHSIILSSSNTQLIKADRAEPEDKFKTHPPTPDEDHRTPWRDNSPLVAVISTSYARYAAEEGPDSQLITSVVDQFLTCDASPSRRHPEVPPSESS